MPKTGFRGATSNPSIFEKAIAGSTDYLDALHRIEGVHDAEPIVLYESLAIGDIRDAADLLRPVYDATSRADGYVSLEVSPYLAHDTDATIAEARRLWKAVGRENVMIKVPASMEGLPAIRALTGEGINVNITLLFGIERYDEVARAYVEGLFSWIRQGGDPARVCSVASFFVSRIDTQVDGLITARLATETDPATRTSLTSLLGTVAIANAKLAYQRYLELCRSTEWQALAARGAAARSGCCGRAPALRIPRYRDVRYVEELIGAETINTIPPRRSRPSAIIGRLRASSRLGRDGGARRPRRPRPVRAFRSVTCTDTLLEDGVTLVPVTPSTRCSKLDRPGGRRSSARRGSLDRRNPPHCRPRVQRPLRQRLTSGEKSGKARCLWARDATLWTGGDENRWLGWLTPPVTADWRTSVRFATWPTRSRMRGVSHAVLLGMGGSSLTAEVMRSTFGTTRGFPQLHVLDSTDPAQIAATEGGLDLPHTLFIVSSKSGATMETILLLEYFLQRMKAAVGRDAAAVTSWPSPIIGSPLQQIAERERFRQVFFGATDIGGRYSSLSNVGLVPAALMGVDVGRLLERAELMVHSCAASVPAAKIPRSSLASSWARSPAPGATR